MATTVVDGEHDETCNAAKDEEHHSTSGIDVRRSAEDHHQNRNGCKKQQAATSTLCKRLTFCW